MAKWLLLTSEVKGRAHVNYYIKHKYAFQWDAYRPLVDRIAHALGRRVSAQEGGVCPGGVSARGVAVRKLPLVFMFETSGCEKSASKIDTI